MDSLQFISPNSLRNSSSTSIFFPAHDANGKQIPILMAPRPSYASQLRTNSKVGVGGDSGLDYRVTLEMVGDGVEEGCRGRFKFRLEITTHLKAEDRASPANTCAHNHGRILILWFILQNFTLNSTIHSDSPQSRSLAVEIVINSENCT